jgi:hypothetical protein
MVSQIVTCTGASGTSYEFDVDPIGLAYEPKPGVYIFSKLSNNGKWTALFVGSTYDLHGTLKTYLKIHPKLECLKREGATHIGTLLVKGGEAERDRIVSDLIKSVTPPCNKKR